MAGRASWHRLAEEDLAEAVLYIGSDSPAAADRLLDAVENAIGLLMSNPGIGRLRKFRDPRAQGVRTFVVSGFENYLICYRPALDGIHVIRFLHGARDLPRLLEDQP
jgi:plasmid stabilization system protein ParE